MSLLTIRPTDEQVVKITDALNEQVNKILGVLVLLFIVGVVVYMKTR